MEKKKRPKSKSTTKEIMWKAQNLKSCAFYFVYTEVERSLLLHRRLHRSYHVEESKAKESGLSSVTIPAVCIYEFVKMSRN